MLLLTQSHYPMNTLDRFRTELKSRRIALGLKQKDLFERTGLSRQQYQSIEKNGNPTLETLLLIADGLNCELKLIPKNPSGMTDSIVSNDMTQDDALQDPWQGVLD